MPMQWLSATRRFLLRTHSFSLCAAATSNMTFSCTNLIENFPIGLGTYDVPRDAMPQVIRHAIEIGYRRIDCAPVYFNEDAVGDALVNVMEDGLVQRSDLYLVSKLASPFHRKEHVEIALRKSLNDLRVEYLDLYLIHWPVAFHYVPIDPNVRGFQDEEIDESEDGKRIDPSVSVHETWAAMEAMVEKGLVREIGVSNFPVALLQELMTTSRTSPAVNQCEGHPFLHQHNLLKYCDLRGVHFQAYSPLGTPGYKEAHEPSILDDPLLRAIAKRRGCTSAQVALAWALRRGTSVVVKSTTESRLLENYRAKNILLSDEDMQEIAALDRNYRFFRPEDWWPEHAVSVFD